jgi:hypothetical protein
MSEEFQRLDIDQLTADAENGKGCLLRTAISDLGFEEKYKVLKRIEKNNAKHRIDDPSLPELSLRSFSEANESTHNSLFLNLAVVNPSIFGFNQHMYQDELKSAPVTQTDSCTDLKMSRKQ